MNVLASKSCLDSDKTFNKELFSRVAINLELFPEKDWESLKDTNEYKKVLVAVYVRTDRDNLVLMLDEDKFANVFDVPSLITDCGLYPNILIDAGLICGKGLIDSIFDFKTDEAKYRFVSKSTCYPVGAVETTRKYALVFNVVISDELLRDADIDLKQGFHFHPIETLHLTDAFQKDVSKSLVIVKSEGEK